MEDKRRNEKLIKVREEGKRMPLTNKFRF